LPISTIFPYTTLFRSYGKASCCTSLKSVSNFSVKKLHPFEQREPRPNQNLCCGLFKLSITCVLKPFFCKFLFNFFKSNIRLNGRSEEHTSELQSRGHL